MININEDDLLEFGNHELLMQAPGVYFVRSNSNENYWRVYFSEYKGKIPIVIPQLDGEFFEAAAILHVDANTVQVQWFEDDSESHDQYTERKLLLQFQ